MAKYNEKLVDKIITFVEEDAYTISEICEIVRVSRKTFYEWKETKPEFKKALEDAEDRRDENLLFLARTSLQKKLEGYTVKEEKITYIPDKNNPSQLVIKNKVVKEKHFPPSNAAIKQLIERHEKKKEKREIDRRIAASKAHVSRPMFSSGFLRYQETNNMEEDNSDEGWASNS